MPAVFLPFFLKFLADIGAASFICALKRHTNYGFVLAVFFATPHWVAAQTATSAGVITGTVVDAATGAPLTRVLVSDQDSGATSVTGAEGRFELQTPPGPRHLRASVVGYAVAQRDVTVAAGGAQDVVIRLAGGTGGYEESVTVSADRFRTADPGAPAQQVLGSADIQNLRGVLADDPLRAVQVLPGVATGDDLRSEFSVRGSSFSHMHLTIDGFSTPYLLHAVRAVEDASSSGSIAMINSDILQDVSLVSGGYVQRTGDRTGASVEFHVRPGSRARPQVRVAVSGTNASTVVEGPLGASGSRRGAWLVSARQSYLDLVIDRLVDDQVKFGFSDAQAKFQYDLSPSQRVEWTMIAGRSRLREPPEEIDANDLYVGKNSSVVGIGTWRRTSGRSVLTAGILGGLNRFRNETLQNEVLDDGHEQQVAGRTDLRLQLASSLTIEGGGEVVAFTESRQRQRPVNATQFRVINDYSGNAVRVGAFSALRWAITPSVALLPGVRADHWSLTDDTTTSPWLQAEWRVGATTVRGATGIYQQFPEFEQVLGTWGTAGLEPERAVHADVAVERSLGASARVQVTVYDREERDFLRRPSAEPRIVDGRLVRAFTTARFENRLTGYARGVELFVQHLDANGFSGWISYAYGKHRYQDTVNGETFWGDLDQRHTMNLYGLYRLSPRTSFSAKLRVGSNFPAPGYYYASGDRYFVGSTRNELRLPSFARLDLRANRTFTWSSRRLTLFAEVINVLNRENMRYHPPSIDTRTFEARRLFESLLPVVPSAGVLIEF
jgi:hypothetical protein